MRNAVTIRMAGELAMRCADAAAAANMSVPGWLRGVATEAVGLKSNDSRRSTPRAPIKPPASDLIRTLVPLANHIADLAAAMAHIAAAQPGDAAATACSDVQHLLPLVRAASAAVIAAIERAARP